MSEKMETSRKRLIGNPFGFTLVEILIAIAVSAVVFTSVISIYSHMQHSSAQQISMAMLQQNQRGALDIMERELRLIGMDRNQSGNFQITDVRKYSIAGPNPAAGVPDATPTGSPVLRMQVDLDSDGVLDANETITYSLYDRDGDGQPPWELSRSDSIPLGPNSNDNFQLIAEGVEAIGFAYAFDANDDGEIDRAAPALPGGAPAIIWAVDTNGDGNLDAEPVGTSIIGVVRADGSTINQTVGPDKIRGVQFWILGRALRPDPKHIDNRQYSLGAPPIQPGGPQGDHYRRWLLTEVIHCRNL
jgi:prepilin-type N-terminal cleavage/methylation domain-containing protein